MSSLSVLFLMGLAAQAVTGASPGDPAIGIAGDGPMVPSPATVAPAWQLPGREEDGRVARIVYRLATAGRARCPVQAPFIGFVLQHLSQFQPSDRAGMIAALGLDRGPAVIALIPQSPVAVAGLRTGDVLLAIDGVALPRDMDVSVPFDAARAHARADAIADLLTQAAVRPFALTVLRDGGTRTLRLAPVAACPAQVDLARSAQHNAYADGRHVFLTTGLVAKVRSDDELAFIVAHEMAHNILGHAAVMRGDTVKHGLGKALGHSGQVVRGVERAADALGGELMLDAGYDPVAGARILERLDGTDLGIGLFATHDPSRERIAAMRAIAVARHAP